MSGGDDGFLARWSRRKGLTQQGVEAEPAPPVQARVAPAADPAAPAASAAPAAEVPAQARATDVPARPPPTLADAAALTKDSDYTRFITSDVEPQVKNAALTRLFHCDPHFNVMDGLDTYIDDYGRPDPIPESMLRQMVQSDMLGLFAHEKKECPDGAAAADAAQSLPPDESAIPHDENPDLQLQPHDDAGQRGPDGGAGEDAGREH